MFLGRYEFWKIAKEGLCRQKFVFFRDFPGFRMTDYKRNEDDREEVGI
jgi:hypothetical protein